MSKPKEPEYQCPNIDAAIAFIEGARDEDARSVIRRLEQVRGALEDLRSVVTYWKSRTSREEGTDADVVPDLRRLLSDISRSGQADVAARAKDVHIRLGRIPFLSA